VSLVHRRTKEVVVKILESRAARELDERNSTEVNSTLGTTAEPVDHTEDDQGPETGRRRRRSAAAADKYNVELVAVNPPVKDQRIRTAVVASNQGLPLIIGLIFIIRWYRPGGGETVVRRGVPCKCCSP